MVSRWCRHFLQTHPSLCEVWAWEAVMFVMYGDNWVRMTIRGQVESIRRTDQDWTPAGCLLSPYRATSARENISKLASQQWFTASWCQFSVAGHSKSPAHVPHPIPDPGVQSVSECSIKIIQFLVPAPGEARLMGCVGPQPIPRVSPDPLSLCWLLCV